MKNVLLEIILKKHLEPHKKKTTRFNPGDHDEKAVPVF